MFTIFKRDFLAYFRTPVGYVFMGVFLTLSGLIFIFIICKISPATC